MGSFSGPKPKTNACFAELFLGLRPVVSGILLCMSVFLLPNTAGNFYIRLSKTLSFQVNMASRGVF